MVPILNLEGNKDYKDENIKIDIDLIKKNEKKVKDLGGLFILELKDMKVEELIISYVVEQVDKEILEALFFI